ncbi:hypothetical protein WJX72_002657 [[Myrmecia] bisecta]|uniref:tRNA-splicing endonuclease subunit Sen15 domain-containing protein n=1 Tax=[Myrmecia] bisecta TaxID=41462 RepID=A0AAW1R5J7_9CHLO
MDRRWRGSAQQALQTLTSFQTFQDSLPPFDPATSLNMADVAAVYAVHSFLHAAGRPSEPRASSCLGCWYLLTPARPHTLPNGGNEQSPGAEPVLEPVIPVSASFAGLSPNLMQRFFALEEGQTLRHVILALVDGDGTVTLSRMYKGIHTPAEGAQRPAEPTG